MKLTEILHLCLVSQKTGVIDAKTPDGKGTLYLKAGEIVDARYLDLRGEEAFYRLSQEKDCECSLHEESVEVDKTIEHRTEYLLMEAARLIDEKGHPDSKGAPEDKDSSPSRDIYEYELLYVTESDPIRHPIPEGRTVIGRAKDCHIVLNNTTISGHHSEIINREGEIIVTDLNSSNGTYVNSVRVGRTQPVQVNDQIQVGACLFEFVRKGSSGTVTPRKMKTRMDLQDTRKFVLPEQQARTSLKPTVGQEFREVQPVNEPSESSAGLPSAVWYVLIGLGAGAILVILVVLLTGG
jgi:pSer/pThr/pTyr-binding forkhead associated (FHA) protein